MYSVELSSNKYSTNESFKTRWGDPASKKDKFTKSIDHAVCFFFFCFTQSHMDDAGSVHPMLTVTHTSYSCYDVLEKKSTDSSPSHSQMSRNSSRKSNNSLLVNNGKLEGRRMISVLNPVQTVHWVIPFNVPYSQAMCSTIEIIANLASPRSRAYIYVLIQFFKIIYVNVTHFFIYSSFINSEIISHQRLIRTWFFFNELSLAFLSVIYPFFSLPL